MFRKFILAALLASPAAAHADWYVASTPHFTIYSDDKPEAISRFATSLEQYDKAMRLFHHLPDDAVAPVNRVSVFVVRSVDDIQALGAAGAAGFYIPRASAAVAFIHRERSRPNPGSKVRMSELLELSPETVLRHEYAHHFMFNNWQAAALPLWFTEGFAEFHATATVAEDGAITFGPVPYYRSFTFSNSACAIGQVIATSDLGKLEGCGRSDLYGYGWLMTHYLTFTPEGPKQQAAYIDAINSGKPLAEAAKTAFGDLGKLQGKAMDYLHQKKLPGYTVYAAALKVAAPVMRPLTPAETATIEIRIRSEAGVRKADAPGVYARARRAAEPFPNDASAQLVLAEAAFDAKDYPVAEEAARRALAADPKSGDAMLYIGQARMEVARRAASRDAAAWKEIRSWFVKANRNDPYDARALLLYYRSFAAAGETPSKAAYAGLLQAFEFAPQDASLRGIVAYAQLVAGDGAAAKKTLQILAYNPHSEKTAKFASDRIAEIDAGNLAAARAAMEKRLRDQEDGKGDGKDGD